MVARVEALQAKLPPEEYRQHETVKRLKAVRDSYISKIPANPFDQKFQLTDDLTGFGRVKYQGIHKRYRLFFKAFQTERCIIILWLGFPRKDGDKKDCYQVFKKMVRRGTVPKSLEELLADCE